MISRPLVQYVLTAARRDKLMFTLALMIVLGASLSVFMGGSTVIEGDQFSLVFASGGLRFLGILGIVLFVSFYMRRAFEHKEVEFLLSRPMSRTTFLFSHAFSFIILSVIVALFVLVPMMFVGVPNLNGLMFWGASLCMEYAIMAVVALFFSMVLSSAAGSALATFGFYTLSRLIGILLGIAMAPTDKKIIFILGKVMEFISAIVPRLDLMGQTSWLVYGVEGTGGVSLVNAAGSYAVSLSQHLGVAGFIAVQGVLFIALLLAAASFDFSRRRF